MNKDEFDLRGEVALVTGASSGFGAHFCQVLAERGAKVVAAARREDRLLDLVESINSAGGEAVAATLDVTDSASVVNAFDFAEKRFGIVSIVSNNAGVADSKPVVDISEDSWDLVLDTNLKGVWLIAREAGSRMIRSNVRGSIVNTASIGGIRAARWQCSYGTSKAAVIHLTKNLALEWARKNVRVNALCPGYFVTEMTEGYLSSPGGQREIENSLPQRCGRIDELTAPFLLLVSNAGSYINGVALPVDGAQSLGNM